jgi:hypothetical protein
MLIKAGAHLPAPEGRVIDCGPYFKYDHPLQGWPSSWGRSLGGGYIEPVNDVTEIDFLLSKYMTLDNQGSVRNGIRRVVLMPATEASQLVMAGTDTSVTMKMCDLTFNDVTGIRQAQGATTALVDYTVRRANWTPIGDFYRKREPARWPELIPRHAMLERYDDGWRLARANMAVGE